MNLAFCLYKYFPFGGMQRNFLKIAEECSKRGHKVTVYTLSWEGEKPDFLKILIVKTKALRNIKKYQFFSS